MYREEGTVKPLDFCLCICRGCHSKIVIDTGYYKKRDHIIMMSKYICRCYYYYSLFEFILLWEHNYNFAVCHIMIIF